MKKIDLIVLLVASVGVVIIGEVVGRSTGSKEAGFSISIIGGILCVTFGRMLLLERWLDNSPIKLGAETLPPGKDIAAVLIHGAPISDKAKKALLQAIRKAKRSNACQSVAKELPFQIVDHWGGVWDLEAYEDKSGARGFSANRVVYSGPAAQTVAACVGL